MEDRMTAVEKKAAFQEHLLTQLNDALVNQQKKIMTLEQRVHALKDQLSSRDFVKRQEDEIPPPHY